MGAWGPPMSLVRWGGRFRGAVAAWSGNATHTVKIVLAAAIGIARDDSDGGDEARIRYYMYIVSVWGQLINYAFVRDLSM